MILETKNFELQIYTIDVICIIMSMEIIMQDEELLEFIEDFKQGLIEYGTYGTLPITFLYSEKEKSY